MRRCRPLGARPVRSGHAPCNGAATDVAICAIIKNEAAHLLEWVAYHRLIGVGKFFLYDNNSTDATATLLRPLIDAGIVELIAWPYNPGQIEAYHDYLARQRDRWTWTAFIDADEYVNLFAFQHLGQWLCGFGDVSGVALQWLNFGPSGHDTFPTCLDIAAFTRRLPSDNPVHGHIKTIVRSRDAVSAITPHAFVTTGVVVDEEARPVVIRDGDYSIQPVIDHRQVCINHYYTRSKADWIEKVSRGMADSANDAPNRRSMAWFNDYQRDAIVEDDRLARLTGLVSAEINRLRGLA